MRVDVRRGLDVCMSHQLLGRSDVHPCLLQVGAIGVAEVVRDKVIRKRIRRDQGIAVDSAAHGDVHFSAEGFGQRTVG